MALDDIFDEVEQDNDNDPREELESLSDSDIYEYVDDDGDGPVVSPKQSGKASILATQTPSMENDEGPVYDFSEAALEAVSDYWLVCGDAATSNRTSYMVLLPIEDLELESMVSRMTFTMGRNAIRLDHSVTNSIHIDFLEVVSASELNDLLAGETNDGVQSSGVELNVTDHLLQELQDEFLGDTHGGLHDDHYYAVSNSLVDNGPIAYFETNARDIFFDVVSGDITVSPEGAVIDARGCEDTDSFAPNRIQTVENPPVNMGDDDTLRLLLDDGEEVELDDDEFESIASVIESEL